MENRIVSKEYADTAVFEPAEEGGFVVTFPTFPGLVTEVDTLALSRAMAADAIRGYLESLRLLSSRSVCQSLAQTLKSDRTALLGPKTIYPTAQGCSLFIGHLSAPQADRLFHS